MAKNQFIIDLITTSLLDVSPGTYTAGDSMFVDGTECDILYMPRSADLARLPPVIIETAYRDTRVYVSSCTVLLECVQAFPCLANAIYRLHL